MSAAVSGSSPVPLDTRERALAFAHALLVEQGLSARAATGTARVLGLLLVLAREGPVRLSGAEGARLCGFEPRTWWLVRRRLLELGHLVASVGGPLQGGLGGRGRKAAYAVAPATIARFQQTLMARPETLNVHVKPLVASEFPRSFSDADRSHHLRGRQRRERQHQRSPRLEEKRTSDVLFFEGRTPERSQFGPESDPARSVLALLENEPEPEVRIALTRLLGWTLLLERLERAETAEERAALLAAGRSFAIEAVPDEPAIPEPADPAAPAAAPPKAGVRTRRPRAPGPLWSPGEDPEYARVLEHVREVLAWANRDFGAHFDLERSSQDARRYSFETVRAAVANVLLKRARGYRFVNPGAVLWDGITLEGYKLDEFAVARLDEVLAICAERSERAGAPSPRIAAPPVGAPPPLKAPEALAFDVARRRRDALRVTWEGLAPEVRAELDRRAEIMARQDLEGRDPSPARVALGALDRRAELVEREHAEAFQRASAHVVQGDESQNRERAPNVRRT